MQTILVISPHPDDEAIGCGGAICKHVAENDIVHVIFLTSGEKGGHGKPEHETISVREKEATEAAYFLKIRSIEFWHERDGSIAVNPTNIRRLVNKIKEISATIIYVPHEMEQHPDHRAAANLVSYAIKELEDDNKKPLVLMYEIWTPIQKIDHIIDITPFVELKRDAIIIYKSQCAVIDFDQAVLGLNRYRGEMHSWPEGEYAEVFKYMD